MRTFAVRALALLAAATSLLALPAALDAQVRTYGLNQTDIFEINIATGAGTSVRTITGPNKAALAQRASDGMIFFITGLAGNDSVFTWNPAVPAAAPTFIGTTGASIPYLPRLAFDAAGTLHAINTASTQRYTINQVTGAATAAGAALTGGSTAGGDLVVAPNGNMYQVLGTQLYIVPLAGGALTSVGNITGVTGTFTGLAIDRLGRMLGSNSSANSTIYAIPFTAGAATAVGTVGDDLGDLGSMLAVDLRILKSHTGNFTQGQTGATYSLVVSDSGNLSTSGTVTVTDTLPAGLTPVSAAGTGWTCPAPSGQVITCTRASVLASGASYPAITVTVNVSGTAPASVTNRAWVSGGGEPAGNPGITGNNFSDDATTINGATDLIIAKTHSGNFTVGVNGVYTLTVTNQGRLASSGTVTVTDVLPAGLSFVSGTGTGWSCGAVGQTVTCTNATAIAASGGTSVITLTVGVAAAAAPSVTNSASVAGGGEPAGNTGNNASGPDVTTVIPSANLGITKTDGVTSVNQGATLTYTIVASNAGPNAVTAATVTDNFPAQVTAVTWTCAASGGSSCPASGSGNIAASVNLLSGGTATFTVTATASGAGTISNTATIAVPGGVNDPVPGNNSATDANTVITPTSDLFISKTDGVTAVNQGGTVTYTIVASNA
ncbi:MAG: DUF11 domain-containing protein, partial [Gemmatimonadales bacterium]|nr:DUF11 domain-containing protein [Gemmatimonadales bacterium]